MKKIFFLMALLSMICLFTSCDNGGKIEGLKFYPQDDGSFYIGGDYETFTADELVIPKFHKGRRVTGIAKAGFRNCDTLTSVSLPDTIKVIAEDAFSGCTNLRSINLSDNITSIEHSAFFNCGELTSINFPQKLEYIGASAFYDCKKLQNVILPDGVLEVGGGAFNGCENIQEVYLPESLEFLGSHAFSGCTEIRKLTILGPEVIEDETFKAYYLSELYIGDKITTIKFGNRLGNNRIEKLRMSGNIEYLAGSAIAPGDDFEYNYYNGQKYYGNENNPYVVLIANGKDSASQKIVAHEDTRLVSVNGDEIPMSLELSDGIVGIDITRLSNYEPLVYSLYKNGKYLGTKDNPYYMLCDVIDDDVMEFIIHPDCRVINVGLGSCDNLYEIDIPKNVCHISQYAFRGNENLCAINVDPENEHFISHDGLLYSGDGKTLILCPQGIRGEVTVMDGVTDIGRGAFSNCNFITSLTLPDGIKVIHTGAIDCSELKDIYIPLSIEKIHARGLENINSAATIHYNGTKRQWKKVTLSNINSNVHVVYIP